MKKSILILAAAAAMGLTTTSFAQTARQIDRRVAAMRQYLHLTGAQAGTIRGELFAASDEKRAIAKNPALAPDQKQRRMKEITKSTREQIRAALTPSQLAAWKMHREMQTW
jgi:cytochrome c556